jgi:hypothetical protein
MLEARCAAGAQVQTGGARCAQRLPPLRAAVKAL